MYDESVVGKIIFRAYENYQEAGIIVRYDRQRGLHHIRWFNHPGKPDAFILDVLLEDRNDPPPFILL